MSALASLPEPLEGPPRRWLWVTTVADVDGPGRALSAVLTGWPRGDAVLVCALRTVSPAFRRAIPDHVETVGLHMHGGDLFGAARRLARLCREWTPDVVHTSLSRADWMGRVLGWRLGIPVVSTIHNVHSRMYEAEFPSWLARIGRALDHHTLPLAARVVAVSRGVRTDIERTHARRDVVVIPNGLDLRRFAAMRSRELVRQAWAVAPDARVVGTVSGLKTQKGIADLVDAAARVSAADSRAVFLHIGTGPLAADMAARIDRVGLGRRFRLLGHLENPIEVLSGLDLFAMPSLWEGCPIALLEAMAAGLPVVGTRVSGIEDLIDDGQQGQLVPPGDPVALARAITTMLDDVGAREKYGRSAQARAATMGGGKPAAAYRRLFVELADRAAMRTPSSHGHSTVQTVRSPGR